VTSSSWSLEIVYKNCPDVMKSICCYCCCCCCSLLRLIHQELIQLPLLDYYVNFDQLRSIHHHHHLLLSLLLFVFLLLLLFFFLFFIIFFNLLNVRYKNNNNNKLISHNKIIVGESYFAVICPPVGLFYCHFYNTKV
jgi:hypothetical protein